jgi:hypothetical protein
MLGDKKKVIAGRTYECIQCMMHNFKFFIPQVSTAGDVEGVLRNIQSS